MAKKISKFLFWTPRITSIIFILFLAMFSLDVFDGNPGFWEIILGLLIHNVPVFFLIGILLVSWKYEFVGGIGFILGGIIYLIFILRNIILNGFEWYYLSWAIQISGIAFFIGVLFFINWFKKKK